MSRPTLLHVAEYKLGGRQGWDEQANITPRGIPSPTWTLLFLEIVCLVDEMFSTLGNI